MKLNLTYAALARIIHATLTGPNAGGAVDSFITDSRKVAPGSVFWALKGENFDGSHFAPQAAAAGAAAIICARGSVTNYAPGVTYLEVEDTLSALQTLAAWHRHHMKIRVACITGSNGKSTVKQMLLAICSAAGPTAASMGNFNNQFGVPFSLLEITPGERYGVFELGASKKGDIIEIARPAAPDVGIITNIAPAHLEKFKDLQTVYETKTEIIDALNFGGTLVYNSDDILLRRLKTAYKGKAITFGCRRGADVRITNKENFEFVYKGETFLFNLKLEKHNKLNAAAACAGAIALGLYKENLVRGLASYVPMPMRLEVHEKRGVKFILDCYNANPASMKNALTLLAKEPARPLTAVLGDMKELGKYSKRYHAALAKTLVGQKIQNVFLSGPEMKACADALAKKTADINVKYSLEYKDWLGDLKKTLKNGGTCLVKASRAMQFEKIYEEF